MLNNENKWRVVLLTGPTGSGKTPLGQELETKGLLGEHCLHFDFGKALREAAEATDGPLTANEQDIVRNVLNTGALLEDGQFPIAQKILHGFLNDHNPDKSRLVVLNGLPRHTGQAKAIESAIEVRAFISLDCSPQTVRERIRTNAGGDRGGRKDDNLDEVERRLEIFKQRTALLREYYRVGGVPLLGVEVGPKTRAKEMLRQLETRFSLLAQLPQSNWNGEINADNSCQAP